MYQEIGRKDWLIKMKRFISFFSGKKALILLLVVFVLVGFIYYGYQLLTPISDLVVLWYSGYRPEHWFRRDDARQAIIKRAAMLTVAIVVLSVFLVGVTVDSYQRATTEEQIQSDTAAAIEEFDGDRELEQLDVEVHFPSEVPFEDPRRAVVTVGVPPGETATGLAAEIRDRVERSTGSRIEIEVRYIDMERQR